MRCDYTDKELVNNSKPLSNLKCWINIFIIYPCVNRNSTKHTLSRLTRTITYTDHQPRYPAPSKPASETLRRQGSVSQQPCTAASRRPSSPPRYWHQRSGTIAATARAAMPMAAAAAPAYQTPLPGWVNGDRQRGPQQKKL